MLSNDPWQSVNVKLLANFLVFLYLASFKKKRKEGMWWYLQSSFDFCLGLIKTDILCTTAFHLEMASRSASLET